MPRPLRWGVPNLAHAVPQQPVLLQRWGLGAHELCELRLLRSIADQPRRAVDDTQPLSRPSGTGKPGVHCTVRVVDPAVEVADLVVPLPSQHFASGTPVAIART